MKSSEAILRDRKQMLLGMLLIICALSIWDWHQTSYMISKSGIDIEWNPIMHWMIVHFGMGGMLIAKIGVILLAIPLILLIKDAAGARRLTFMMSFVLGCYATVVAISEYTIRSV